MATYPAQRQNYLYAPNTGSVNQWHSHPPYQGAPPIPTGVNINPQQWQAGFWQPNPAFNPGALQSRGQKMPYIPWVPGQSWSQIYNQQNHPPQQSAASHNPYKRAVKEPSAEYLATKLSDNPLGLSNMIPAEQLNNKTSEAEVDSHTPWIWSARTLDDDTTLSDKQQSQERPSIYARRSSEPPDLPHDARKARLTRQASEPPPVRIQVSHSTQDRTSASDHASQSLSRDRANQDAHPRTSDRTEQPEETFTAKRNLQPTFSPNIVRIPEHYQATSPSRNSSRNSHSSRGSVDAQLAARMERLSTSSHKAAPLTRHASMPHPDSHSSHHPSCISGPVLFDEPLSVLSPLVISATPKTQARAGSSSLDPIAEAPSRSVSQGPRLRHMSYPEVLPSYSRPRTSRPPSQHSSHASSLNTSPHSIPGSSPQRHTTPPSNPLPEPPMEIRRALSPPRRNTPPAHYRERVRKGFWNCRGDHLTMTGHIVYAPPDKAYPPELRGYPAEGEGYKDYAGAIYEATHPRPELPESLPRHGQPPIRPYESFITYEYRF